MNTNRKFTWASRAAGLLSLFTMKSFTGEVLLTDLPEDPLKKKLEFKLREQIPGKYRNPIRAVVRLLAEEGECVVDRATFHEDKLVVLVMLKHRNVPFLFRNQA